MSYQRIANAKAPGPHKRNYFIRSLGLELPTLLRFGSLANETPKPVYRSSIRSVLSESAVHILPILASLTIVTLNLKTIYLGRTLTGEITSAAVNIAILQVTSKLVELLTIASLTNVVIHTIRNEMVLGDGVPFGAISGVFMFSSLSFLWSPELWGSISSRLSRRARFRIIGILVFSGVLAATIGPSTAVLLIPKEQDWIAGGSEIYLRDTDDRIWPGQMEFTQTGFEPFCSFTNATNYAICPSGGYQSMLTHRTSNFRLYNQGHVENNLSSFSLSANSLSVASGFRQMPKISITGNFRSFACQTSMTGIHGAEAIYLSQLIKDWQLTVSSIPYNPLTTSMSEYKYYNTLRMTAPSRAPVVRVACSNAQNISGVEHYIEFPILPEYGCWKSMKGFKYNDLNQTPSTKVRATWTQLPESFGRVSTGLLIETPWTQNKSRAVLGCSVDARWADATLLCKGGLGVENNCESSIMDWAPGQSFRDWPKYSEFRPTKDSSWSSIELQQSWLDVLTPSVTDMVDEQSAPMKTIENLLYDATSVDELVQSNLTQVSVWNEAAIGSLNRTTSAEWVIASLVADGLSREGSARVLNTTLQSTSWSILDYSKAKDFSKQLLSGGKPLEQPLDTPFVKKRATVYITGYSYKASVFTDYLSIAVHIIYMLLAFYHAVMLVIRRRVSACWDSITECFALMQNSQPAIRALSNTSAGVRELRTYAQVVNVRAMQSSETVSTNEIPHLELIFREEEQRSTELMALRDEVTSDAKLANTSFRSRTWAPGSRSSFDSSRSSGYELRFSDQGQSKSRHVSQADPVLSKVQADTLYG